MTTTLRDDSERFRLYRLCPCDACNGLGKLPPTARRRCPDCRGEGRTLALVATASTAEAVGTALVTLAREDEFESCPVGLLDAEGETGRKWLVSPWQPSPRNVSDAGRLLQAQRGS